MQWCYLLAGTWQTPSGTMLSGISPLVRYGQLFVLTINLVLLGGRLMVIVTGLATLTVRLLNDITRHPHGTHVVVDR